eukprot:350773-Chlamydomonas_euryale.AAC.1
MPAWNEARNGGRAATYKSRPPGGNFLAAWITRLERSQLYPHHQTPPPSPPPPPPQRVVVASTRKATIMRAGHASSSTATSPACLATSIHPSIHSRIRSIAQTSPPNHPHPRPHHLWLPLCRLAVLLDVLDDLQHTATHAMFTSTLRTAGLKTTSSLTHAPVPHPADYTLHTTAA